MFLALAVPSAFHRRRAAMEDGFRSPTAGRRYPEWGTLLQQGSLAASGEAVGEIFDEPTLRLSKWPITVVNSTVGVGAPDSVLFCMHLPLLRQLSLANNGMTMLPTRFGGVRARTRGGGIG